MDAPPSEAASPLSSSSAPLSPGVGGGDASVVGGRRRLLVAVAVLLVAVVAAVAVRDQLRSSPLARAQHLVGRDARFSNGPKAAAAFADVSHMMLSDATSCAHHHGSADRRCAARYSAAAFTSVSAFVLVDCTQPGVFRARQSLLVELRGIATVDQRRGLAQAPAVPPVPVC